VYDRHDHPRDLGHDSPAQPDFLELMDNFFDGTDRDENSFLQHVDFDKLMDPALDDAL
jgi:hypothetical protein